VSAVIPHFGAVIPHFGAEMAHLVSERGGVHFGALVLGNEVRTLLVLSQRLHLLHQLARLCR